MRRLQTTIAPNGFLTSTPSRSYRYQILLDFACTAAADQRTLFAELLTFDLYLRENLKSRPGFLPEQKQNRDSVRCFYEKEEQTPQYLKNYEGYTSVQLLRMTHIEQFSYPVWKKCAEEQQKRLETPAYILFDYQKRNALTHDAVYYEITL